MADLGRAISAPSVTRNSVIGRSNIKTILGDSTRMVHTALNRPIFDHINYPMMMLVEGCESTAAVFAGPTCDSLDRFGYQETY